MEYLRLNIDNYLLKDGAEPMSGPLDMSFNKITNIATGNQNGDAVNKLQMDNSLNLKVNKSGDTMSGSLDMSFNKITNIGDGTSPNDTVNKSQVDASLNLKVNRVGDVVMTGNLTLNDLGVNGGATIANRTTSGHLRIRGTTANISTDGGWIDWNYNNYPGTLTGATSIINQLGSGSGGIVFGKSTNQNVRTVQMLIKEDGNIGIGTTTPTEKLDVSGNCFIEGNLSSSVAFVGANTNKQVNITNNNHGIWLNPRFSSGSWIPPLVDQDDKGLIFSNGTKDTGNLVIGPWSDSSKGIKIIGSTGNVGIGITPSYKLHVNGDTNFTQRLLINGNSGNSGQSIISRGPSLPPVWSLLSFNVKIPINNGGKNYGNNISNGEYTLANLFTGSNVIPNYLNYFPNTLSPNISGSITFEGEIQQTIGTGSGSDSATLYFSILLADGTVIESQRYTSGRGTFRPNASFFNITGIRSLPGLLSLKAITNTNDRYEVYWNNLKVIIKYYVASKEPQQVTVSTTNLILTGSPN